MVEEHKFPTIQKPLAFILKKSDMSKEESPKKKKKVAVSKPAKKQSVESKARRERPAKKGRHALTVRVNKTAVNRQPEPAQEVEENLPASVYREEVERPVLRHQRPQKDTAIWMIVGCFMVLVIVLWIFNLRIELDRIEQQKKEAIERQDSSRSSEELKKSLLDLKNTFKELNRLRQNDQASTTQEQATTSPITETATSTAVIEGLKEALTGGLGTTSTSTLATTTIKQ